MKIPIKIVVGNVEISSTSPDTWGDVATDWDAYAQNWDASSGFEANAESMAILDMFNDESVSLKQVVKDLKDPKKLFTDYSRSFTVPASKKNNRIFKHYANIDITNGLDSRELIPAKILLNNVTYKTGNILVESVRMSGGVALHYKLKFFGKLSELSKKIGQDKLSSLDWSALDIYNGFTATNALVSSNKHQPLVFPISSRSKRLLYDSSATTLDFENVQNIAAGATFSGFPDNYGIDENLLLGCLSVRTIIDKIAETYGLKFEGVIKDTVTYGGIYNRNYVDDLYLWLHQQDQERTGDVFSAPIDGFTTQGTVNVQNAAYFGPTDDTYDYHFSYNDDHIIFSQDLDVSFYNSNIYYISLGATFTGEGTVRMLVDGEEVASTDQSGVYSDWYRLSRSAPQRITFESDMQTSSTINVTMEIMHKQTANVWNMAVRSYTSVDGSATVGSAGKFIVKDNMPKMKVMEFLEILFKKFNLIAEVSDDLTVTTKHYDHFMSLGEIKDLSEYIGIDSYDVLRPNIYSSLHMQFAEPKVALEEAFLSVNGRKYGEMHYELAGSEGNRLSGGEYKVELKSQRVPVEPLTDGGNSGAPTTVQYTQFGDLKGAEQSTKPMFTYLSYVSGGDSVIIRGTSTYSVIQDYMIPVNTMNESSVLNNVNYTNLQGEFLTGQTTYTPAAPSSKNTQRLGLYFGEEINEYNVTATKAGLGLWNNFYKGITKLMFDENKRRVKYKAMIPQGILQNLKLSDTLLINNQYHLIESIETNFLTGESKLECIIVGTSQLEDHFSRLVYIYNDSTTEDLIITRMNDYGEVVLETIATATLTGLVGDVITASHEDYRIVNF